MREAKLKAIELIKQFEGLRLKVYCDRCAKDWDKCTCKKEEKGLATIGYGHRCHESHPEITPEKAVCMLEEDINATMNQISRVIIRSITENQWAALISFTFNLGIGRLKTSTLLKMINSGLADSAGDEFLRWNKDGGKVVKGLTARREKEREVFNSVC